MADNANVTVEPEVAQVTPSETDVQTSSYQAVVKKLVQNGAKRISNCKIKNVNFTEKDNYTMISLTLINPIRGYVSNDNGMTYETGMTNTIFTSLYAIIGAMKEDEDLGWMGNTLLENPKLLNLILNGSSVDIIQQDIPAGTEFTNPFTTRTDADVQVYDHDIILNHCIKFKLGKTGEKMADKLADKLMGF